MSSQTRKIMKKITTYLFAFLCLLVATLVHAQIQEVTARAEGEGIFNKLIIRGVTLINGNGATTLWASETL